MSRIATWACLSFAGLAYWGLRHGFAASEIEHFAGPTWFGGLALLVHWISNTSQETTP